LNIVINFRRKQLDGLVIYKYSAATSTSTSTSNLYSSTTRVQVQVPSTTSLLISKYGKWVMDNQSLDVDEG